MDLTDPAIAQNPVVKVESIHAWVSATGKYAMILTLHHVADLGVTCI